MVQGWSVKPAAMAGVRCLYRGGVSCTCCRSVRTHQPKLYHTTTNQVQASCKLNSLLNVYAFLFLRALNCLCVPFQRSTKLVLTVRDCSDSARVFSNCSSLPRISRSVTFTTRPPSRSL